MTAAPEQSTDELTDELTVTEALRLADTARDELLERLVAATSQPAIREDVTSSGRILLGPSLWPTKHKPRKVGFLRWEWRVTDQSTDEELASGRALTETWAWHKTDAAASRIHSDRLLARERRAAERRAES